jgi:hypothetical protein
MEQPQCFPKGGLRRLQKRGEVNITQTPTLCINTEEGIQDLWTLNLIHEVDESSVKASSTLWIILNGGPAWLYASMQRLEKAGWIEPFQEIHDSEGALSRFPTQYFWEINALEEDIYEFIYTFADEWGMSWACEDQDDDWPEHATFPLVHRRDLAKCCPWDRDTTEYAKQYLKTPECLAMIARLPWSPPYIRESSANVCENMLCPCCFVRNWRLGDYVTPYQWLCVEGECPSGEWLSMLKVEPMLEAKGKIVLHQSDYLFKGLYISLTDPPWSRNTFIDEISVETT